MAEPLPPGSSLRLGARQVVAGARAAVIRGRAALQALSEQVAADEDSNKFSALNGAPSIIDAYSAGGGVAAEVRWSEQREAELRSLQDGAKSGTWQRRCCLRARRYCLAGTRAPSMLIFLLVLGALSAVVAFTVEAPVSQLIAWREQAVAEHAQAGFVIWVCWTLAGGLVAGLIGHLAPLTEGSGIPQVKSILSGSTLHHYLGARVGAAKVLGLIAAQGGGLSTGREGPFVHVACCVAAKLWHLPYFRAIAASDPLRRQMLAAAVAAGVTGIFVGGSRGRAAEGTRLQQSPPPRAGRADLWRALRHGGDGDVPPHDVALARDGLRDRVQVRRRPCVARGRGRGAPAHQFSLLSSLSLAVFGLLKDEEAGFRTTAFTASQMSAEVVAFAALGALCGVLGSVFVYALTKVRIARKIVMTSSLRRYGLLAAVSLFVGAVTYMTPYTRLSDLAAVNDLFSGNDATATGGPSMAAWKSPSVWLSLSVFFGVKLVTTVLSISLPIPCGLFMPLFLREGTGS